MTLADAVRAITGQDVMHVQALHGGDLSDVKRVTLSADHSTCVVKTGPHIAVEARMLNALAAAHAPVPDVFGTHGACLILEDLGVGHPLSPADPAVWTQFSDALSRQYKSTALQYGWDEDYAFGALRIPGGWHDTWPEFWATKRLACNLSALPPDIAGRVERLALRLTEYIPAHPRAALLHGDMWLGNLHLSQNCIHLIDPACFYGDPEVDLAFLHLFGTPHSAFTQRQPKPAHGFETRRAVYQLWPALVHLRLFGTSYRGLVTRILDSLGV